MKKTLIKNIAVYHNHTITEHENMEISDDTITAFPKEKIFSMARMTKLLTVILCWLCRALSILITT